MADAVAAVVEYLEGLDLAPRVFGVRMTRDETRNAPRAAILVRAAGGAGTFGGGYMPEVDNRVDVRCYGATEHEAAALSGTASAALHNVRDARTGHGRIMWARRGGGPVDLVEPDTGWPFTLTSWQVLGDWLEEG